MEKEEQAKREAEQQAMSGKAPEMEQWADSTPAVTDWATEGTNIVSQQPIPTFTGSSGGGGGGAAGATEDWNVGPTTATKDWAADDAGDWGNAEPKVIQICPHTIYTCVSTVRLLIHYCILILFPFCRPQLGTGRCNMSVPQILCKI